MKNFILSALATQSMSTKQPTTASGIPPVVLGIIIAAMVLIAIIIGVGAYKKSLISAEEAEDITSDEKDSEADKITATDEVAAPVSVPVPANDPIPAASEPEIVKSQPTVAKVERPLVGLSIKGHGFMIPDNATLTAIGQEFIYKMNDEQDSSKVWAYPVGSEDTLKSIAMSAIDTVKAENYFATLKDPAYNFIVEINGEELYFYDRETLARKAKAVRTTSSKKFDIPVGIEVYKAEKLLGTFLTFDGAVALLKKANNYPKLVLDGTTVKIGTYELRSLAGTDFILASDSSTGSFCVLDKNWTIVMEQIG